MMVLVPPSWLGVDDLLSIVALFHMAKLELLWFVLVSEGRALLSALIVYDSLDCVSYKVL